MKYLNTTRTIPVILFVALTLLAGGLTGCAGGDMATVRIKIALPNHEVVYKPGFTDHLLAFLTFSAPLKADPPPVENPAIDTIQVMVSGPGMSTITKNADVINGYVELGIPSGNSRQFEVRAGYAYSGQGGETLYYWYYGSETVLDLAAGETKNLSPLMISFPLYLSASGGNGLDISWEMIVEAPYDFEIQYAQSPQGPYNTIYPGGGNINNSTIDYWYNNMAGPETGYIRIRPVIGNNDGVFSEPVEIIFIN